MVDRKISYLGYFDNESDAANAFDVAEVKLRGTPRLLTSAHRGVSWAARPKRWRAQIRSNGVNKHIGYFKDEKSAHEAYIAARTACDLAASEPRLPTIVSSVDLVSRSEADPPDAGLSPSRAPLSARQILIVSSPPPKVGVAMGVGVTEWKE